MLHRGVCASAVGGTGSKEEHNLSLLLQRLLTECPASRKEFRGMSLRPGSNSRHNCSGIYARSIPRFAVDSPQSADMICFTTRNRDASPCTRGRANGKDGKRRAGLLGVRY